MIDLTHMGRISALRARVSEFWCVKIAPQRSKKADPLLIIYQRAVRGMYTFTVSAMYTFNVTFVTVLIKFNR